MSGSSSAAACTRGAAHSEGASKRPALPLATFRALRHPEDHALHGCHALLPSFAFAFVTGCFGDNSGSETVLAIANVEAPEGVDAEGGSAPVTVTVHGLPDEQLTVAVSGTLGTFTPEQKVVITDARGDAAFVTQFTAGAAAGLESATAAVSNLAGGRASQAFSFPVTALTRAGEVASSPPR